MISDGSGCTPKWNGTYSIGNSAVKARISALKESGASVRVSFGGASGKELAEVCDSATALAAAYGAALDAAGSAQADFDIAWVSMWSTFRDQQCEDDDSASDDAATNCSGVTQSSGAFAEALAG